MFEYFYVGDGIECFRLFGCQGFYGNFVVFDVFGICFYGMQFGYVKWFG